MKIRTLLLTMLLCPIAVVAQTGDPVVMRINGIPISRSEFEYSYNKNNSESVIDRKSVEEYAELFINYKLKVVAAMAARLDTLSSFKSELALYRGQQVLPTLVTDADLEAEARRVYEQTKERIGSKGLIKPAHILIYVGQKAPNSVLEAARLKADSLYAVLKRGGDFASLARRYSQDSGSARNEGELSWLQPGQTFKEFEDAAYALKEREISRPVLSPIGFHIIQMKERKALEPYDSLKTDILKFIEARGIREKIANDKLDKATKVGSMGFTREEVIAKKAAELEKKDPFMKYLITEYHDGLLLYEISNRTVWNKAANDEVGLKAFFNKNKKRYYWTEPRYKGMVFHVKNPQDVQAVKASIKKQPFNRWDETLRYTFNNDSVLRVQAEKGLFKKGDNAFIDRMIFKKKVAVTPIKGYPIDAVCGKLLKKKPESFEDVRSLVSADYQEELEKQWVKELRATYTVEVNKEVLETVNKHNNEI